MGNSAFDCRPRLTGEGGESQMAQDELVASAIAHWGPRFTVNGVTVTSRCTNGTASVQ